MTGVISRNVINPFKCVQIFSRRIAPPSPEFITKLGKKSCISAFPTFVSYCLTLGDMLRCEIMGSATKANFSCFGYRTNINGFVFYFQHTILVTGLSFEAFLECNSELEHLLMSNSGFCAQSFLHRLVMQIQSQDVIDQIVNLPFDFAFLCEATKRIPKLLVGPFVLLITRKETNSIQSSISFHICLSTLFQKDKKGDRGNLGCSKIYPIVFLAQLDRWKKREY